MRIVHILNHTHRSNGHVHAAIDLACAQSKLGHQVCVASGGGDFKDLLTRNGVETVFIDMEKKSLRLLGSVAALHKYLRAWRPDIVHAHMITSAVLSYPICKLAGVPLITTVHNEFEDSATLMRVGTRVIAVSEAVSASMRQRGVSEEKLRIVLNGTIGSPRFADRSQQPVTLKSPSILFVGGLHPRKGLPDLLDAFDVAYARYPTARLYVVGGGPMASAYRKMAERMRCAAAVSFVGAIDNPSSYMRGADIFVLPSHADPAPLVLSEAREARCAVIGTNVDGIPQLLEHGDAGILVPPHDPAALAAALCDLLESPSRVQIWQEKSQLRIDYLTVDRVVQETMLVYVGALEKDVA